MQLVFYKSKKVYVPASIKRKAYTRLDPRTKKVDIKKDLFGAILSPEQKRTLNEFKEKISLKKRSIQIICQEKNGDVNFVAESKRWHHEFKMSKQGHIVSHKVKKEKIVEEKKVKENAEELITAEKSKGHLGFFTKPDGTKGELYQVDDGDIYTAPLSNVIDITTKNRIGRFEASAIFKDRTMQVFGITKLGEKR